MKIKLFLFLFCLLIYPDIGLSWEYKGGVEQEVAAAISTHNADTTSHPVQVAPNIQGKVDRTGTAVNDDDCTGEQGDWWWDSTDLAFEFCNQNSGAPTSVVTNDTNRTVAIGTGALALGTTPTNSTAIGYGAGDAITSAINTTLVGYNSGTALTTAYGNTAFGSNTLQASVTGNVNTAVGTAALYSNTNDGNSAFGNYALWANTGGYHNTGLGYKALEGNTTGLQNTSVGFDSSLYKVTGDGNVAAGYSAMRHTSVSNYNVMLGATADYYAPAAIGTATAVAGSNLGVGTYTYRISYVLDGLETVLGAVKSVTTTTSNKAVDLSAIPTYTGSKTCSARKIYRIKLAGVGPGDGAAPYYLVDTIADNVTTTYSDTTADASLGASPNDPDGSIVIGYGSKAFGDNEIVIGYSATGFGPNTASIGIDSTTDTFLRGDVNRIGASTHGGFAEDIFYATSGTLTGATDSIPLAIPAGWRITQCQLHVKTAVVDSVGDDTWSSELNDGAQEEIISAGSAAAQNTNVNHWAVADTVGTLTDAETNILLTPNGGNFSAGEIEAQCTAIGFIAWSNE